MLGRKCSSFTLRLPRHCSSARSPSPRASRSCRSASEQCRRRATSPIWTPIARSWTRLSDGVTRTSLRARDLESAIEKYLEYVGSAQLDRSESIEDDEQAQAELASDRSEAFATFTPLGVGAEKSCSRSGYCAGQRVKIG